MAAQMDVSTDSRLQCLRVKEGVLVANPVLLFFQFLVFIPHLYLLRLSAKCFNSNP